VNVNSFKGNGLRFTFIGMTIFLILTLLCAVNAIRLGDNGPILVLVFFGSPLSWLVITFSESMLNWIGPYNSISRVICEWLLLAVGGCIQYGAIGFAIAQLFSRNSVPMEPPGS
jgi:hypothetical protein